MLKNYKELKVCELETQTMISGDLNYMNKEKLQELREELRDARENAKSDDQIPGKQALESLNPGLLEPFLPTNWEKILTLQSKWRRTPCRQRMVLH